MVVAAGSQDHSHTARDSRSPRRGLSSRSSRVALATVACCGVGGAAFAAVPRGVAPPGLRARPPGMGLGPRGRVRGEAARAALVTAFVAGVRGRARRGRGHARARSVASARRGQELEQRAHWRRSSPHRGPMCGHRRGVLAVAAARGQPAGDGASGGDHGAGGGGHGPPSSSGGEREEDEEDVGEEVSVVDVATPGSQGVDDSARADDGAWKPLQAWNQLPHSWRRGIQTFVISFAMMFTMRMLFVEPRFIPSSSMHPTFHVGDFLTVDKISTHWRGDYQRRDVVIFRPPAEYVKVGGVANDVLIKRIVAIGGDTVEMKPGGILYVNGIAQREPYVTRPADYVYGPVKVPEDHVFVLGDNRSASFDSHGWGPLPRANIIGRATLKYWPPRRWGRVEAAPP